MSEDGGNRTEKPGQVRSLLRISFSLTTEQPWSFLPWKWPVSYKCGHTGALKVAVTFTKVKISKIILKIYFIPSRCASMQRAFV